MSDRDDPTPTAAEVASALPPITVGMSMLSFVPGGMGGSETYARALADGLASRRGVSVVAAVAGNVDFPGAARIAGVTARETTLGRLGALMTASLHSARVRAALGDAQVVHFPFTVPVPRPAHGQATVLTIHDVQHRELPHLFSPAERLFRVFTYDRPARRADLVITISEFARRGVIEHLGVSPDRVRVVPLGVDAAAFTPNLGPRERFLLYPARGWPHKNHARLFEAMSIVQRTEPDLRLVLTGGGLDALGPIPEGVEVRGLVPEAELRDLYRRAAALVFPSLYEGFGLPPLEAMASGCPVAASTAGSIPEVCGDAAVLFDPEDPDAIARGVLEAISRAGELTERGLAHVRTMSWDRCIDGHVDAYRAALSQHSATVETRA